MNAKTENYRCNTSHSSLKQGKAEVYYGHCRWCLVIAVSLCWLIVTRNFELAPIIAFAVYLIAHFPAKWVAQHSISKHS